VQDMARAVISVEILGFYDRRRAHGRFSDSPR
jgi:hypothetical protein